MKSALTSLFCLLPLLGASASAEETTKIVEENGIRYQETRRITERPIYETKMEEQQRTVYCEQVKTEQQTTYRQYQEPVTEYYWEPYWVNRWNPFSQPYLAYRYVPRVRYETRTQEIRTPVVKREMIPKTQTVQVPVPTSRMVKDEVFTRVAIGVVPKADPFSTGDGSAASVAQRPQQPTPAKIPSSFSTAPQSSGSSPSWTKSMSSGGSSLR